MTSYKSELEMGLPYAISLVVKAYWIEKDYASKMDFSELLDDLNRVVNASAYSSYCTLCMEAADKKEKE
nr:MAG TPA: hypothetical protein [Caudoviricetes sp.]